MAVERRKGRTARGDRGQAAVEFIGMLPLLVLLGLALVQIGLAAYTVEQAGTGARAAARAASRPGSAGCRTVGGAAMSGWIAKRAEVVCRARPGEVTATVTVRIPSIIVFDLGSTTKSVTMPVDTARP
ncbi:TadE/TadG family type IV pilus assembly protein [Streptomyces sp. NPDC008001]|uniref:TadE/TadG family type IV pilus assembly protein n=1 Tax=Streptomyces sp. NPDC008001 TaxID=3364804 RepID=UPI0036EA4F25